MNDEHLKRIAVLLRETANEIEALTTAEHDCKIQGEITEEPKEEELKVLLPVEEAYIETAAEAGEGPQPQKRTVVETRDLAAKALKAKLKAETKAIISKYGESITWVGDNAPDMLGFIYEEIEALLEAHNA